MNDRRPIIVAVSGLSSNTGKTTLVKDCRAGKRSNSRVAITVRAAKIQTAVA